MHNRLQWQQMTKDGRVDQITPNYHTTVEADVIVKNGIGKGGLSEHTSTRHARTYIHMTQADARWALHINTNTRTCQ